MTKREHQIPAERKLQFDLIELASTSILSWADENGIPLKHIYPIVPFVETDFSLDAWLFLDTESRVYEYKTDGTAEKSPLEGR